MSLGIIITLIFIEIYYNYFYNENTENFDEENKEEGEEGESNGELKNSFTEVDDKDSGDVLVFNEPNPWCKVIVGTEDISKYFIRINNFDEGKYLTWKRKIDTLDYDVENKTLILETKSEPEALALINLIISNMNDDIEFDEIIQKNLIAISINKAQSHKLVCNKLVELIKENSIGYGDNNISNVNQMEYSIDSDSITDNNPAVSMQKSLNIVSDETFYNEPMNNVQYIAPVINPYGGSEYALI